NHIGELKIPISQGVISKDDVIADYYELSKFSPWSVGEITLFKNGGGAHLDIMISQALLNAWQARC
ncbi:MAG: ornithine cyclodeaminase, partial [Hyphomicrobiales bacterium]